MSAFFFYSGSLSLTRRKRKEGHAEGGGVESSAFLDFNPSFLLSSDVHHRI